MTGWILTPFLLQSLVIGWDEFYFHRKRGLPLWERIGHPLDTLSLLVCALFPLLLDYNPMNLKIYAALAIFSSLLVTKDEKMHLSQCSVSEMWLHSLLFLLHPLVLVDIALLWSGFWGVEHSSSHTILVFISVSMTAFFVYQVFYWLILSKPPKNKLINNEFYEDLGEKWYEATDDPIALLRSEARFRNPVLIAEIEKEGTSLQVLDVACGAGFLSNVLSLAGHIVTGIDTSSESLRVAQRYDSTGRVQYLQMNANQLSFPDETFDAVCAMDFLEHIDDRDLFCSEVSRVLKPGGRFFFHTFNRNLLSWLIVIKGVEWFVANTPKNMHVLELFVKPREIISECKKHGMTVEQIRGVAPKVFSYAFFKMLFTRRVPEDFSFQFTLFPLIGYSGTAKKL